MTVVSRVASVALAGVLGAASIVHAQGATAEALFREGRALIQEGKLEQGCNKLEASEKLESSVGTLLNLGDCREKLGKRASAWAAFHEAELLAQKQGNDKKRQQEARRRALKLEPDLATITVQVGPKSKTDGVVIRRDGDVVDPDLWGTAIFVDPGSHTVIAEAPGHLPWTSEVNVGKGARRWVVVPSLEPIPVPIPEPEKPAEPPVAVKKKAKPPAKKVEPPPEPPIAVTPAPPSPSILVEPLPPQTVTMKPTWNTTRGIAVALGVVGATAIGTGIWFGHEANSKESESNAICPGTICDDTEGLRLNDDAQDNALAANILFATGGAAVITATVMWFVGGPDETVITPSISDSHVGASLSGRF